MDGHSHIQALGELYQTYYQWIINAFKDQINPFTTKSNYNRHVIMLRITANDDCSQQIQNVLTQSFMFFQVLK